MERRRVMGAGVAAVAAGLTWPGTAWAAAPDGPAAGLAAGVGAGRRLFAAGAYDALQQMLPPLLLAAARHGTGQRPAGAGAAAGAWVLASQLAVKQDRTAEAGVYAGRAGTAARASGDPLVLAAAARAAATPLRRTGRAGRAQQLLQEAHDQLAGRRAGAADLDAAGMVALTAAYTAAQARYPSRAVQFADLAEETAGRLSAARTRARGVAGELSAGQCVLYRVGIHRELGQLDVALAYAAGLQPAGLPTPERRARAATDTARTLLAASDTAGAFAQLRRIELAAPLEPRRPAVRALAAAIAARRPGLTGLDAYLHRTGVASPV